MSDSDKILNNLRRQCSRREYCESDVLKKAEKANALSRAFSCAVSKEIYDELSKELANAE